MEFWSDFSDLFSSISGIHMNLHQERHNKQWEQISNSIVSSFTKIREGGGGGSSCFCNSDKDGGHEKIAEIGS